MFSGDSPGVPADTTSEESLYGGVLEYIRRAQEQEDEVGGVPRSQSYTEGIIVQQSQEPQPLTHAYSHNALLEETPPTEAQKEREPSSSNHSCLHTLHTVVACQQEQIAVLQATLRDLAVTYTHREKALLKKVRQLQQQDAPVSGDKQHHDQQ
ncbi:hypothetical protein SK128_028645, partial [Halocaridina rubra]